MYSLRFEATDLRSRGAAPTLLPTGAPASTRPSSAPPARVSATYPSPSPSHPARSSPRAASPFSSSTPRPCPESSAPPASTPPGTSPPPASRAFRRPSVRRQPAARSRGAGGHARRSTRGGPSRGRVSTTHECEPEYVPGLLLHRSLRPSGSPRRPPCTPGTAA